MRKMETKIDLDCFSKFSFVVEFEYHEEVLASPDHPGLPHDVDVVSCKLGSIEVWDGLTDEQKQFVYDECFEVAKCPF